MSNINCKEYKKQSYFIFKIGFFSEYFKIYEIMKS